MSSQGEFLYECCDHCGCVEERERVGHDDACREGCNDAPVNDPYARGVAAERARVRSLLLSKEAVEAFGVAWGETPAGVSGARRLAGLRAVADLVDKGEM